MNKTLPTVLLAAVLSGCASSRNDAAESQPPVVEAPLPTSVEAPLPTSVITYVDTDPGYVDAHKTYNWQRDATYLFNFTPIDSTGAKCAQREFFGNADVQNWQLLRDIANLREALRHSDRIRLQYNGTSPETGCLQLTKTPEILYNKK